MFVNSTSMPSCLVFNQYAGLRCEPRVEVNLGFYLPVSMSSCSRSTRQGGKNTFKILSMYEAESNIHENVHVNKLGVLRSRCGVISCYTGSDEQNCAYGYGLLDDNKRSCSRISAYRRKNSVHVDKYDCCDVRNSLKDFCWWTGLC